MFPLKPQSNYIIPIRWRVLAKFAFIESIDRNIVKGVFNEVIHKLILTEVNINASFLGVKRLLFVIRKNLLYYIMKLLYFIYYGCVMKFSYNMLLLKFSCLQ